jgi:hypothetical protein
MPDFPQSGDGADQIAKPVGFQAQTRLSAAIARLVTSDSLPIPTKPDAFSRPAKPEHRSTMAEF